MNAAESRWGGLTNFVEQCKKKPAADSVAESIEQVCGRKTRLVTASAVTVVAFAILMIAHPPFICAREESEEGFRRRRRVSLSRLLAWTSAIFAAMYFCPDMLR